MKTKEVTMIKASIDATDNAYIIRIYEEGGALCNIHVVEELEMNGENPNKTTEFKDGNALEIAACKTA